MVIKSAGFDAGADLEASRGLVVHIVRILHDIPFVGINVFPLAFSST